MAPIDFGVFLSTERPDYESLLQDARLCEGLGYHSVWISDHLLGMYEEPGAPRFECWTTSSALLADTARIRLGQLVLCNPLRHPPLLAKMAASLDAISGGRLILGLGTGWHEGEFRAYGYPYEPPAARVRRLEESARIIRRMWGEEAPSFGGRFYSIKGAYCSPKPIQRPGPPLLIAGGGERLTLRTVARNADISNFAAWMGTPEEFKAKSEALDRQCMRVGREPAGIRRSWAAYTLIAETDEGAEMSMRQYTRKVEARYGGAGGTRRPPLAGNPEQIVEQVRRYIDAGVSLFIIRFMGENIHREAEVFADEVLPNFR